VTRDESLSLQQLYVQPDECEDFDAAACERLIATIAKAGVTTVDDVSVRRVAVSLEDFFEGNRCKHSIAANVTPSPPYDTAESWYGLLKTIRDTKGVNDVVVEISMIEPYEDGRVAMWPYADTIWIYSSLARDAVAALVAPLEPGEVGDASTAEPGWSLKPPYPASDDVKPFWVWWD
jgi:hypothetical protein